MLRHSAFCFHYVLLITHYLVLVHLYATVRLLLRNWMMNWLGKEWLAAKSQYFVSSVIESALSKDIKLERPVNFSLNGQQLSARHEKPTWWLQRQACGCFESSTEKAFPIPKTQQQCTLLGLEASWEIFSYLKTLCKAQCYWVRFTTVQGASGVCDGDPGNEFCLFSPHFFTLSLLPTDWVEPGASQHLSNLNIIQALWSKRSSSHSKISIYFYTLQWCSTPTLPKGCHVSHAACLLVCKARTPLLLPLSLLVIDHILCKGSG